MSDILGLYGTEYKVRLTTMGTGELQFYSIEFPVVLGTGQSSWGGIKKIHR